MKKLINFKPKNLKTISTKENRNFLNKFEVPKEFIVNISIYKLGHKPNSKTNIMVDGVYYFQTDDMRGKVGSYYVELPKYKYKEGDICYIYSTLGLLNGEIYYDLQLYETNDKNQNYEMIMAITHHASTGVLIRCEVFETNDKSNDTDVELEDVWGDQINNKDIAIYNQFINLKLNIDNQFVPIYESEYINNNYNALSCVINILLEYKEYFEGKWHNGIKLYKN